MKLNNGSSSSSWVMLRSHIVNVDLDVIVCYYSTTFLEDRKYLEAWREVGDLEVGVRPVIYRYPRGQTVLGSSDSVIAAVAGSCRDSTTYMSPYFLPRNPNDISNLT